MNSLLVMMVQKKASRPFPDRRIPARAQDRRRDSAGIQDQLTALHTLTLARSIMNDKQAAEFERTSGVQLCDQPGRHWALPLQRVHPSRTRSASSSVPSIRPSAL